MRNMWIIIKKELRRFFTDKRMLISLILPGLMIFVIYSLMGDFLTGSMQVDDSYKYQIVVTNEPTTGDYLTSPYFLFLQNDNIEIITGDEFADTDIFAALNNKEYDLYVKFDADFFDSVTATGTIPNVKLYYNSTKVESFEIYNKYYTALSNYEVSLQENLFDINPRPSGEVDDEFIYDRASTESISIQIIVSLIPFLLIIFLYTGAMSISIESIAGEKERGTIATLLATPTKRSEISLGKVFALSIVSLVSAASSFIGLMLSIPKLMQGSVDVSFDMYGAGTYLLLFAVLISTVLIFVVLVSLVSAYAKTVKEASAFSSVLMIANMLIGITSMAGKVNPNTTAYLIPVYNSVQSISSILSLEFNLVNFLVTIATNLVFVAAGIYLLTRMFNSEKIMFNK